MDIVITPRTPKESLPDELKTRELAARLDINDCTVRSWIATGVIPSEYVKYYGRKPLIRIKKEFLDSEALHRIAR